MTYWSLEAGQVNALVIGVGGFLGAGEKDVAVPFSAGMTTKDKKTYLTMTSPQRRPKPRVRADSDKTAWVPAK